LTSTFDNAIFSAEKVQGRKMKIKDILSWKIFTLSFEVFPPKRDGNLEELFTTILK